MMKGMLRGIVLTAVVVIGIAVAVHLMSAGERTSASAGFTVAQITRQDVIEAVTTTGRLSPSVVVEVSSQISGLVTELNVDFNSRVKQGDVLARIDPSSYEQRLQQARADLAAAEASHSLAEINARRMQGLREQDLITQQEYDEIEAQLRQSQASLTTRRAALENARVDLERCTITAPIDGIVIYKQIEIGKTVVSSFSAPTLFVIAQDLSRMRIIAPVSEVDVGSVHPGLPVSFTVDALPDERFQGELIQIRSPYTPSDRQQQAQAQQQNPIASFDAVIEVDNPQLRLRPSFTANVSIIVERRENVLAIPNGALRVRLPGIEPSPTLPEGVLVYRLPGGDRNAAPEQVQVRLGITDSMVTEVLAGLDEGDTVITGTISSWETDHRARGGAGADG